MTDLFVSKNKADTFSFERRGLGTLLIAMLQTILCSSVNAIDNTTVWAQVNCNEEFPASNEKSFLLLVYILTETKLKKFAITCSRK